MLPRFTAEQYMYNMAGCTSRVLQRYLISQAMDNMLDVECSCTIVVDLVPTAYSDLYMILYYAH